MATHELGAPAYRKFDMEAWMPAEKFWGEVREHKGSLIYMQSIFLRYQLIFVVESVSQFTLMAFNFRFPVLQVVQITKLGD